MTKEKGIRVRFAPSPTGKLHLGNARAALFNLFFAKAQGGEFILRIEDTDKKRSKEEFEENIISGLKWLGIEWDEFYKQSENVDTHKEYLEKLLKEGWAYYCFCSKEDLEADRQEMLAEGVAPKYSGRCRRLKEVEVRERLENGEGHAIRFKVGDGKISFKDLIRGEVSFDTALIGDFVIARDIEDPLYHFAVVVDDALTKITHVIRGEDHISNTPRQIMIMKALGFDIPEYAHLPIILNPDRSKMSKRFSDTALSDYIENGFLSEAMVNFLAYLGWHPKEDKEIMSLDEIVQEFSLDRVQKGGAVFNVEKLEWLNNAYIKEMSVEEFLERVRPFLPKDWDLNEKMVGSVQGRVERLSDAKELLEFYFELPEYEEKDLAWKDTRMVDVTEHLQGSLETIEEIPEKKFEEKYLEETFLAKIDKKKRGEVLWPLRFALSGQKASPSPFEIMEALGKEESVRRVKLGLNKIGGFDF